MQKAAYVQLLLKLTLYFRDYDIIDEVLAFPQRVPDLKSHKF